MLIFKKSCDLNQLTSDHPFKTAIQHHLERTEHLEGYLILIEEGDRYIDLPELKADLHTLSFDGVFKVGKFYHAVYLTNNEFALEFIIPDAPWLAPELKQSLEDHSQK